MLFTEAELIQACIRQDRLAQELLYKKYSSAMQYICNRYAQSTAEADDILIESFLKVFRQIESYKGNGSFEGWMKRIFINTAIDAFKKSKKNSLYIATENEYCDRAIEEPDSWEVLADALSQEELLEMIDSLPSGYKIVFNLYAIENYTHKQIADWLGISEGTSKSQLAKAKRMLKEKVIAAAQEHHLKVKQIRYNYSDSTLEN
jgi:RNA polymerase sigma-70 factor (ECF subfamily)